VKPWTITLGERSWTDEDATVAHVAILDEVLGIRGWDALSPWSSPVVLAGWITVLESAASGLAIGDVMAGVQALTVGQLAETLAER
jgi:hypothetical protein